MKETLIELDLSMMPVAINNNYYSWGTTTINISAATRGIFWCWDYRLPAKHVHSELSSFGVDNCAR